MINFKEITKKDKELFDAFFQAGYYENSHLNFTNLFMWREPYQIMWAVEDGVLYMKAAWEGKTFALQPICPAEKMPRAIGRWLEYFAAQGEDFVMSGVERSTAEAFESYMPGKFLIEEDRDNFDYVYLSESLITLAGRKLHSKKNHLNSFKKLYPDARYLPITPDIITLCKITINGWYKKHAAPDDPIVAAERSAIIEVLNNFADLRLEGAAIMLDKRVIAFTFGEALNADTAVIHVEKADPEIRGAYTAINQGFVENSWRELKYINREEDMGLEGLRKAKLSYKPEKMIEKFNVSLKK